jgi:hypothetical protein
VDVSVQLGWWEGIASSVARAKNTKGKGGRGYMFLPEKPNARVLDLIGVLPGEAGFEVRGMSCNLIEVQRAFSTAWSKRGFSAASYCQLRLHSLKPLPQKSLSVEIHSVSFNATGRILKFSIIFFLWKLLYKERYPDILVVQVQPPCYLTYNSSARYPDCCAQITCPTRPHNNSFSTGKLRLHNSKA